MLAYVIMPDHVHLLIQTPDDMPNYSPVIHSIKRNYSFCYKQLHHIDHPVQIWQERFFDHVIRDDTDFDKHLDYIHYNPVKHECVEDPIDWRWSSLSRWINEGVYESGWGCDESPKSIGNMNYE
jgi:REP-associated tyrosine transposase